MRRLIFPFILKINIFNSHFLYTASMSLHFYVTPSLCHALAMSHLRYAAPLCLLLWYTHGFFSLSSATTFFSFTFCDDRCLLLPPIKKAEGLFFGIAHQNLLKFLNAPLLLLQLPPRLLKAQLLYHIFFLLQQANDVVTWRTLGQ